MTAKEKIAQNKLTLLQLAEKLRSVSEACRRRGVSRSQFYEYKRTFQEEGFSGLMDRPPLPRSFPNETSAEIKEKVIKLSIDHPAWGQVRVSDQLRLEGIQVSLSTIRNIWLKEGLESKYKRILRLEELRAGTEIYLTEEQIRLLEKANPCFRERNVESLYPGHMHQDVLISDEFSNLRAEFFNHGFERGQPWNQRTKPLVPSLLYIREHCCLKEVLRTLEGNAPHGAFLHEERCKAGEIHLVLVRTQDAPEVIIIARENGSIHVRQVSRYVEVSRVVSQLQSLPARILGPAYQTAHRTHG